MRKLYVLLILIFLARVVYSSDMAGTAGMQFLKIGADARGNSLGGAVVGEVSGVDSIYWNPAGLNSLEGKEVMLTYNRWLSGMNYFYLGFGMPLSVGNIGASVTFLNEGELDMATDTLSELSSYDLAVSGAYAIRLGIIEVGASVRFITKKIFEYSTTGGVIDIGGKMNIPGIKKLEVGMLFKNLGFSSKIGDKPEGMPMMYQVGGSYLYKSGSSSVKGILSSDIMIDDSPYLNIGLEYGYKEMMYVRLGYKYGVGSNNNLGMVKGLTAGVGASIKNLLLNQIRTDVAFIPMGDLGNIIQISLSTAF